MPLPAPSTFVSRRRLPAQVQNANSQQILGAGASLSSSQSADQRPEVTIYPRSPAGRNRTQSESPRARYNRLVGNHVQQELNSRSLLSNSQQLSLDDLEWMLLEADVTEDQIDSIVREHFLEHIFLDGSGRPDQDFLKLPDQNDF